MRRAQSVPGRAMRALALSILGSNAEKQVAAALRCTPAQAHRIVAQDRCPRWLRAALLEFLDRAIVNRREALERAEQDIREIRFEGMVGRAAARRQQVAGQGADKTAGSTDGAGVAPLKGARR